MLRLLFSLILLISTISSAWANDVYVHGYSRRDGTYVQPHYRTSPNGSTLDNYSTSGNINPYTGSVGTRSTYGQSYDSGNSGNSLYSPRKGKTLFGE